MMLNTLKLVNINGKLDENHFITNHSKFLMNLITKILKPIIIPGIDLDGNLVYEEELKMKNSLINNQPVVKLAELKYSSKKLIKLTLLDENGNILQEAILTEEGFKFVLLNDMNEYNFKISNFPDNLDLSEIPIEIFYENSEVKLIGNFTTNQSYKYKLEKIDYSDRSYLKKKFTLRKHMTTMINLQRFQTLN